MSKGFKFHHLGIAVTDSVKAVAFYAQAFGLELMSGPFDDPIQHVRVCFLGNVDEGVAPIELICPLDGEAPVNGYLTKGLGAYHVCYEVPDLERVLTDLRRKRCLVISNPVPAVAFGGRRIAWCFTPTRQLIELLERGRTEHK